MTRVHNPDETFKLWVLVREEVLLFFIYLFFARSVFTYQLEIHTNVLILFWKQKKQKYKPSICCKGIRFMIYEVYVCYDDDGEIWLFGKILAAPFFRRHWKRCSIFEFKQTRLPLRAGPGVADNSLEVFSGKLRCFAIIFGKMEVDETVRWEYLFQSYL